MKYRKKPIEVEAFELNGKEYRNSPPTWFLKAINEYIILPEHDGGYLILTPEGRMQANKGDMIIKGIRGEIYPCKKDIFDATYDLVEENEDE